MIKDPGPFIAYRVTDYPTVKERENGTQGVVWYALTKSEAKGAAPIVEEIMVELHPDYFKITVKNVSGSKSSAYITGAKPTSLGEALNQGIARIIEMPAT